MNQQYPLTRSPAIENRKLWNFAFRFTICVFQFSVCNFLIFSDGWSADRTAAPRIPTIVRLSFWLSPDRMGEFETEYEKKLVPILKKHGLEESSERGRPTVEGVFSRLFEVRVPSEIPVRNKALGKDDAWITALKTLGSRFGTLEQDGMIRNSLHLYSAPGAPPRVVSAGTGKIVSAGQGRGHWRTYDVTDGLADVNVQDILQDREGALWFATSNGVSRYDGRTWTNLTTREGLGDNRVKAMLQDRDGVLWFGSWRGGVSRFDPLRLADARSGQASTSSGQALRQSSGQAWANFSYPGGALKNEELRSIIQDRDGVIWFGTTGGVGRYDGKSYTTFTKKDGLADNHVWTIFEDRDGTIWFGTERGGVSRYDGKKWETFTTRDGLANNFATNIFQDSKGYIWIGFGTERGGVSRHDGKKWETFTTRDGLANSYVTNIFRDSKGYLWIGTEGGGLSRYDLFRLRGPKGRGVYPERGRGAQDVTSTLRQKAPRSLSRARSRGSGQVSPSTPLRSAQDTASTSSGRGFTTYTTKDGLGNNRVDTIFEDREGVLWVGTQGGGVSRFDGTRFSTFTTEDGLANNVVRSIFQDREGHLWFCTSGGVSQYSGPSFTTFAAQDGLGNNQVETIFEDGDGILWIGTDGSGVSRYDGVTFTRFTVQDGLVHDEVRSIFEDRGGVLWFGTRGGMSRYDGVTFTNFTLEGVLRQDEIQSIFRDRAGDLWFSVEGGGLIRYNPSGAEMPWTGFTSEDGMGRYTVFSIFQDRDGILWFGTMGAGVSRFDPSGSVGHGGRFITYTKQDGIGHDDVFSIFQDREGFHWFGTQGGGVSRYDGKSFETFTTQDGLANNVVRSMVQDPEGHLWFGTFGGGVSRYDGNDFQNMDLRDGLAGNQVLSVIQDRNGNLWFGAYGGLTRYRQPPSSAPLVSIEAVVADRRYGVGSELEIPSSVNLTAFEFKGISFKTRAESMVYRYRLKGYEEVWKSTRARRVEYPDLPRGDYTFEVMAVDRDLVPSDRPASVAMRIRLPYERIAWVSALGIAIGLIAWQTTRVVQRGLRLREGEARFRGLSEATFEGIALHEEGKILDANQALASMFGYESSEMIGKTAAELSTPESHKIIYRNIQSGNERPYEVVGLKKDGSTFPIEVIGRAVPYRGRTVRVTAIRDLTDRKRAEAERAKLDEQLQQLRYLYRLRSAMAGGRSPDEIIGKAGESVMEVLSVSGAGGALIDYEGRTYRFGETDRKVLIDYERALAWGDRKRGVLRVFCNVELSESQERALLDETAGQIAQVLEARELELQILQSARLVSLGQMAAGVAHELNQPLGAISNTAGDVYLRLEDDIDLPKNQLKKMMQNVLGRVKHMAETVGHLRVFSRDSSEEEGVSFSINDTIRSSLGLLEAQLKTHGIVLHLDLAEGPLTVSGNPHHGKRTTKDQEVMEQVFLNLIGNARDALDEKEEAVDRQTANMEQVFLNLIGNARDALDSRGRQTADGKRQAEDVQIDYDESYTSNYEPRGDGGDASGGWAKRLIIRTRREGDDVLVEVEDNGVGIHEENVGRVFEPFFTTKEADKGTGLGLSISFAFVKDHGGEIVCESRKGEGTVFRVRVPAEQNTEDRR